jgi:hypothetical protein
MNAAMSVNGLSHSEIRDWLERALHGGECLPLLTPDESPYLGVLRLEKELKPAARDSLRDASVQLVRRFCQDGQGRPAFLEQLLHLASSFKDPETVRMLADLAARFPQLPQIPSEIRLALLAVLIDTPPPQSRAFWNGILNQDPEKYAIPALSGVLAINPTQATQMLPLMPDAERAGQAAALNFDLAWDDLPPDERFGFAQKIRRALPLCGPHFAAPVRAWVRSKQSSGAADSCPGLEAALSAILGAENSPKAFSPKLCPCLELAAA